MDTSLIQYVVGDDWRAVILGQALTHDYGGVELGTVVAVEKIEGGQLVTVRLNEKARPPAPAVPVAPPEPPLVLSELDRTRLVGEFRRKAEDWGLLATTNDPGTAASTEAMYESLVDALNTGRPIVGAPLPPVPPVPERED